MLAPAGPRSRSERLRAPVVTVGALAAATLALRLRDPHGGGSWGLCPSAALGLSCPGCGGLRAVNDLTHGDVAAAASSNLLVTLGIPLAVVALALWTLRAWRGTGRRPWPPALTRAAWTAGAVVALVFTVLRNTPAGAWLAP